MLPSSRSPRFGPLLRSLGSIGCILAPAALALAAEPEDQPSLGEALKKGRFEIALRYRAENVSDDAPAVAEDEAYASTLRSTLGYRSARYHGFSFFAQFEDVTDLGFADEHANGGAGSLGNGVTGRPTIADPALTETNQVFLRYSGLAGTTLTAGRQEITLADERFVGPVGWRQNHQSFDALSLTQASIPRTKLLYAFVANVNRVFGDDHELAGHLLDAEIALGATGHLTPYLYSLDYDTAAASALSTRTFGVRWRDAPSCRGDWSIPYHLEVAQQTDVGDNPIDVDAGYLRLEVGGKRAAYGFGLGYERLDGRPPDGQFSTPLATLHRFNGWADKFLTTPVDGLEDLYLSASGTWSRFSGVVVYHDFAAESSNLDYGTEVDAQITYNAAWKQEFGFKVARYDADGFAADTEKLWLWTSYTF